MEALFRRRAIAHRGLHDHSHGIIENTQTAFRAAIAGGYAIETDIQAAAGGEPVVFHDKTLDRLTEARGLLRDFTVERLQSVAMRGTRDGILPLGEFLQLIDGRTPLFLEIKSEGGHDRTLERHVAALLASYRGPVAVMSFDPDSMEAMKRFAPQIPRGFSAMSFWNDGKRHLSQLNRFRLTHMLDAWRVKPDFLTYEVSALPGMARVLRKRFPDLPLLTWTVRTADDRRKARLYADGIIFEGFSPSDTER